MSMPNFPKIDPDMTCDRALAMILASIAAEEQALGNIMDAQSQKLRCILDGWQRHGCERPAPDCMVRINRSITSLLDSVLQNQMLLKRKMETALDALNARCPCPPPSCPAPPCVPCPPQTPCKSGAVFTAAQPCGVWHEGSPLRWHAAQACGGRICRDCRDMGKIRLCGDGCFLVSAFVTVRARQGDCVSIRLKLTQNHRRKEVGAACQPALCGEGSLTVSLGNVVVESRDCDCLLLLLSSPEALLVEDAGLFVFAL